MAAPIHLFSSFTVEIQVETHHNCSTYRFHATKVSVMEATRACPYAFPKKIQLEFDRLADEQMQKLKELARRDSLLSSD